MTGPDGSGGWMPERGIQPQHNMEIWEEAHREPMVATGQLILEGYSGFPEMQCAL